jgi:hypothetical protein
MTRRASVCAALAPLADRFQQSGWLVPAAVGLSIGRNDAGIGALLGPEDRLWMVAPCARSSRAAR